MTADDIKGLPSGVLKGRLVRITGQMLGTWNIAAGRAQQVEANSVIFVDISAVDPYPYAPSRVWHPQFGKCWYIPSEYNKFEWLEIGDERENTDSANKKETDDRNES